MLKRRKSIFFVPSFARLNRVPENDDGGGQGGDGGDGKGGGTGGGDGKGGEGDKGKGGDYVSRADHERALKDLNRFKSAAEQAKADKKAADEAQLKEQNKWKELAEKKELEANELRESNKKIQDSYLGERKYNAVRDKCAALGLRAEAMSDLEMLDLNDITVETTSTGKINILGADKFAERLKTLKPHWFADPKAPSVNTNGARVLDSTDTVTAADVSKAEAEGRKSGDMSKYREMHKKFQQQRQTARRG